MINWLRKMLGRTPRKKDPVVARLVAQNAEQTPRVREAIRVANVLAATIREDYRKQDEFLKVLR